MKVAITGPYSYSGKYIARRLLAAGHQLIGLTNHPDRGGSFGAKLPHHPLAFDDAPALSAALRGCDVLVNTYWIRFDRGGTTHAAAVGNSERLLQAALMARVRRIVHISITNPSPDSRLPYFAGKAAVEGAIQASGLSYAILRPTVLFGLEDILVNNIAWLLRSFPVFIVPGKGDYRLQPVYVDDVAALAVHALESSGTAVIDAVGPDILSFRQMVQVVGNAIGRPRPIVRCPVPLFRLLPRLLGPLLGDVILTDDEIDGLMAGLLVSRQPSPCPTSLAGWLAENAAAVGRRYASELERHYLA